jgi:hypothetical protein
MFRAIAAIASIFLVSMAHAFEFPVSRPALQQGEVWIYRTIDLWTNKETSRYESVFASEENGHLVFRNKNLNSGKVSTVYMSLDQQPCRTMQGSSEMVCTGAMRFPLVRPGESWSYQKLPFPNGQGYFDAECTLTGTESIEVPAGTFDAIRIDCKGSWTRVSDGSRSGRFEERLWYAPVLKRFVRNDFLTFLTTGHPDSRDRTELVEYRPITGR